jgi:hypothetical protein
MLKVSWMRRAERRRVETTTTLMPRRPLRASGDGCGRARAISLTWERL